MVERMVCGNGMSGGLVESAQQLRVLPLERGINLRDLGGYRGDGGRRVLWRRLFRSGSTHLMEGADRDMLATYSIRTVVDLRSQRERADQPHILCDAQGVSYLAFEHDHVAGNILRMLARPDVEAGALRDMMIKLYEELPYRFAATYRQLFLRTSSGPLPLMFNCTAGKDRTGVAAALLLSALGVGWDDIMADYLLTEQFVPRITGLYASLRHQQRLVHLSPEKLAPVFGVHPDYLQTMRSTILAREGTMEAYIREVLGIDAVTLRQLRSGLLGDTPYP